MVQLNAVGWLMRVGVLAGERESSRDLQSMRGPEDALVRNGTGSARLLGRLSDMMEKAVVEGLFLGRCLQPYFIEPRRHGETKDVAC